MNLKPVRSDEDLWDDEMSSHIVCGLRVLLVKVSGRVYAYQDRCAHLGVPLSEGQLEEGILTCAAHHYQYDVRTGHGTNPKCARLRRYPVEIKEGVIYVDLENDQEVE